MKVLITGVNGFIGKNLQSKLSSNFSIIGVSRNPNNKQISWEQFHLSKPKATVWIHLAGKAHDLVGKDREIEYTNSNLNLTKNVFSAFLKNPYAKKFIFFSSIKAVVSHSNVLIDESYLDNISDLYGLSKIETEKYLLKQKIPKDRSIVILRPCMVHGPNNKGNLNLLNNFIIRGIPYPLGKYSNKRSFLSIDNLIYIINKLIEKNNANSGVYNVADDGFLSTTDLVMLISKINSKKIRILNTPKSLIVLVGYLLKLFRFPINIYHINKLTQSLMVSNKKIKNELGIIKLPISIKEGMLKTLDDIK